MEYLSRGKLKETVLKGDRPESITVQVIASKRLKEDPLCHRLLLWDGCDDYQHAMYVKKEAEDAFPKDFSVIRVADHATPEGIKKHYLRLLPKKSEPIYAFVFFHYTLVMAGSRLGEKINSDLTTPTISCSSASTPAVKPKATAGRSDDTHSPLRPKNIYRPAQERLGAKRSLFDSLNNNVAAQKQAKPQDKSVINRTESDASGATHTIADLHPYQNKIKIKAKVTQMKNIRQFQNQHSQGQVTDCILTDLTGDIKLVAWKEFATRMFETLENDKVFLISGCIVKGVQDRRYNKSSHNYELEWCQSTKVVGPLEEDANGFPTKYNFVPLASIPQLDVNTEVDVAGWVKDTGALVEFTSRNGKDLKKRLLTLVDDSNGGTCIDLTLWGYDAVEFKSPGRIITVKSATIGEWNGGKNLSIGFKGRYEVEPGGVWGVADLVKWAAQLQPNNQGAISKISSSIDTTPYKTLQEIKEEMAESAESRRYSVVGYIMSIKAEGVTYRAHEPSDGTRCMKKVIEGDEPDTFKCVKCNKNSLHDSETTHRFVMQLVVADATSEQNCVAFDTAARLIGKSASELADIAKDDYQEFEELVNKSLFKQFVFEVSAKMEEFRGEDKLKLTIHEAKDVVWEDGAVAGRPVGVRSVFFKEYVQRLAKEVAQMEEEVGESHEELLGISWNDSLTE